LSVQLDSEISNLCGPKSQTLQTDRRTDGQTDGQTDDMRSQYRALHYSASRGKNTEPQQNIELTTVLISVDMALEHCVQVFTT